MDHAVFVDLKSNELSRLLKGKTTAIIRGAAGRQMPCDKVFPGEYVYFVRDLGDNVAVARGLVKDCHRSGQAGQPVSADLIGLHKEKLGFTGQEITSWSKRKHVLLVELDRVKEIGPFAVETSEKNGWTAVEYINKIRND